MPNPCPVNPMSASDASTFKPAKVLVPVDFSSSSEECLDAAANFAEKFHSELYLLYVVPMFPTVPTLDGPTCVWPEKEFLEDAQNRAGKRLRELTEQFSIREMWRAGDQPAT